MIKRFAVIAGALILVLALVAPGCTPESDSVAPADFYRGKTIDLAICAKAGTVEDLVARIIVSYLNRDTGANVVAATRTGAGGLDGMNYVYKAKPDGLTLGTVPTGKLVPNKVFDDPAAIYEIENFSYIMSVGQFRYYFLISPQGPCQSIADLQAGQDLKIGASSPSGAFCLGGLMIIDLMDLDAKVVTGLAGDSNRALAVERGEIIGYCSNILGAKGSIEAGLVKPMFMLATERDPLNPDVPAITELMEFSDEDLALVSLWETTFFHSNILLAPPGTPDDRLDFLIDLANQWVEDEEFRAEINAVAGEEVLTYMTGEEVTGAMLQLATTSDQFQAIFTELIEKYRA